ncbi:hypothetical protein TNIN_464181 [Trichonephila inaurata madagascariensis]|uniref:Uncharacterized protein n=1 Tax=Trichonephila inaurata madagascariensis TaxID=2747483 RepID=A0A8X6XQ76_9ARAC|nr:hypothetical protein TNIN_322241 [Trichonephila inaurata madagascariensis]GFY58147.1 hypothetical protein TNIN_464181 [Trichonephila inaurata madagascariensis]
MEIHTDKTRSYIWCKNCPEIQPLTPKHIFECPGFSPKALKQALIPLMDSLQEMRSSVARNSGMGSRSSCHFGGFIFLANSMDTRATTTIFYFTYEV